MLNFFCKFFLESFLNPSKDLIMPEPDNNLAQRPSTNQTHNPNNYHWSEQDVSQETRPLLKSYLEARGYKIENLVYKMYLTNRMSKLGFIYEISIKMEKDGRKIIINDFDLFSESSEYDFTEAVEWVKNEISNKSIEKVEDSNNSLKEFVKVSEKLTETKETNEHKKNIETVQKKTEKTHSNLTFTFIGKKTDLIDYFFSPLYFRTYAPTSSNKIVQLTDSIKLTNLEKENLKFMLQMDEEIPTEICFAEGSEDEKSQNLKVTLKYFATNPESVKSFFFSFLLPKFQIFFGAMIIIN